MRVNGSIVVVAVLAIATIAGLLHFAMKPVPGSDSRLKVEGGRLNKGGLISNSTKETKKDKNSAVQPSTSNLQPNSQASQTYLEWYEKLESPVEREFGKRMQEAQDEGELDKMLEVAAEIAAKSTDPQVRQTAITALTGEGETTLPVLRVFLRDPNEDVSDAAYRAWDDAVDTIESEKARVAAIKDSLSLIKDEDHIRTAIEKFEMLDEHLAIRELAVMAKTDDAIGKRAKECYESIAGRPWTPAAAESAPTEQ